MAPPLDYINRHDVGRPCLPNIFDNPKLRRLRYSWDDADPERLTAIQCGPGSFRLITYELDWAVLLATLNFDPYEGIILVPSCLTVITDLLPVLRHKARHLRR